MTLSTLPCEIRLKIYSNLFTNGLIKAEPSYTDPQSLTFWTLSSSPNSEIRMAANPLSAQLLRCCQQIHSEAHILLYSSNTFDCSSREGMRLLLSATGARNFSLIRALIIDWEQLQDFAWSLAKQSHVELTAGLESVEMATWRARVLGGSSSLWKEAKFYERQLLQAAVDICAKHKRLRIVGQKSYSRAGRVGIGSSYSRVKWRFVVSESDLNEGETMVDVKEELEVLTRSVDGAEEAGSTMQPGPVDAF